MGVFSRNVDARVVALGWSRTVVVEQGRWQARRTAWKPHGDNVRNLRTVRVTEPDLVWGGDSRKAGASMPKSKSHEVMADHTYFEYEEFEWHKYRSFSARGDDPAGVHWPEHALEPGQRVSERREAYHATFPAGAGARDGRQDGNQASDRAGDGGREYTAELDEATWRSLRIGRRCRLKVGALSDEVKQVTRR